MSVPSLGSKSSAGETYLCAVIAIRPSETEVKPSGHLEANDGNGILLHSFSPQIHHSYER